MENGELGDEKRENGDFGWVATGSPLARGERENGGSFDYFGCDQCRLRSPHQMTGEAYLGRDRQDKFLWF
jgi:hypothetical protein